MRGLALLALAACSGDGTERWCNAAVDTADLLATELRTRIKDDATACRELAGMGDFALGVAVQLRATTAGFALSERAHWAIDAVASDAGLIHAQQSMWKSRQRCFDDLQGHYELAAACSPCPRADDVLAQSALSTLERTRRGIVTACAPTKAPKGR